MIVKPRNLKRVNPALASSLPQVDDPGHMLRESLTTLKGSLTSTKGLLHFDVCQDIFVLNIVVYSINSGI